MRSISETPLVNLSQEDITMFRRDRQDFVMREARARQNRDYKSAYRFNNAIFMIGMSLVAQGDSNEMDESILRTSMDNSLFYTYKLGGFEI
ncbi:hypothetical protein HOE04_04695 [archaeon]|jgi:hypothetical protein|nr:hypothetical protein [archaeon]